jgi:spore coat protein CotH
MTGKALFFKSIAVQQEYSRSKFKQVPDDLTVAQGIRNLEERAHSRGQQTNSLNTRHDAHPRLRQSYKRARSELMHEKRATSLLVTRNQI